MLGILLIDKPQGPTSHDVVNTIRRRFQCKRVGHAGSLDPLSTGLLAVAVGPATRFLQYLDLEPKEYIGEAHFGVETDTQDVEGQIRMEREVPLDLEARVRARLVEFTGEVHQTPPMYSAVKVAGKPLYAYARKGIDVDRHERVIFVDMFELMDCSPPHAKFRIVCSGGTYVRTLFHDLGRAVGCGAAMSALRRIRLGRFSIDSAVPLSDAKPADLIPLESALANLPTALLSADESRAVLFGQAVPIGDALDSKHVALADQEGRVFAVGERKGNLAHPVCVIPMEHLAHQVPLKSDDHL